MIQNIKTKVNGVWKDAMMDHTKVNGVWKNIDAVWTKINGKWHNDLRNITFNVKSKQKKPFVFRPQIGDIVYSDKTWSKDVIEGKTAVGVITDVRSRDFDFIALHENKNLAWSTTLVLVSDIPIISDKTVAKLDFKGLNNTKGILAQLGSNAPAATFCKNYSTQGFPSGSWYLPSCGQMYTAFINKDTINSSIVNLISSGYTNIDSIGSFPYSSSTQRSEASHWAINGDISGGDLMGNPKNEGYYSTIKAFCTHVYNDIPNGIYIYDKDGDYFTEEQWTASGKISADAMGVGVVTDKAQFVMSIVPIVDSSIIYSSDNKLVPNVPALLSEYWLDTFGRKNTESLLLAYPTSSFAAHRCNSYIFPNGQSGYLASSGEWYAVSDNNDSIKSILLVLGLNGVINNRKYWGSTQYDSEYALCGTWSSTSLSVSDNIKTSNSRGIGCLPFTELPFKEDKSGIYIQAADEYGTLYKAEDYVVKPNYSNGDAGWFNIFKPAYDLLNISEYTYNGITARVSIKLSRKNGNPLLASDVDFLIGSGYGKTENADGSVTVSGIATRPIGALYPILSIDGMGAVPNGIAVVDVKSQFVISTLYNSDAYYSSNSTLVPGVVSDSVYNTAKQDYKGEYNTKTALDFYGAAVSPLLDYCTKIIYPSNEKGYVPALGELELITANKDIINSSLTMIGMPTLTSKQHRSSTQYSASQTWSMNVLLASADQYTKGTRLYTIPVSRCVIYEDAPIPDATVTMANKTATTDTNGQAVLQGRVKHSYDLEIVKDSSLYYGKINNVTDDLVLDIQLLSLAQIIFDTSISDPRNIAIIDQDLTMDKIFAKNGRVLFKRTGDNQGTYIYLDSTDTTKFKDGTTALLDTSQGDAMVVLPEFWYKYEKLEGTKFCYWVSDTEKDSTWVHIGQSLVGTYKGYANASKLYSRSGVTPTTSTTYTNFASYAAARGAGYQLIDFQQHCVIALLLYAKYKNRNSQNSVGNGSAVDYPTSSTGTTNQNGNKDTVSGVRGYVNGLGIEGVFGGISEWVQGVSIQDNVWTITDPDGATRKVNAYTSNGWITGEAFETGPFFDMVPTAAINGSDNTYYSDNYHQASGGPFCLLRSYGSSSTFGGVAYSNARVTALVSPADVSSRLAFRGTLTEETDVAKFKAIPIV